MGVFCALSRRTNPNGTGASGQWIPGGPGRLDTDRGCSDR